MATKKTPEADTPEVYAAGVPEAPLSEAPLSEAQVKDMIANAAAKFEHHARASVTSNELQMFAAMAQQGMLANRSNVGMDADKLAKAAVQHGYALAEALEDAAYAEIVEGKDEAEPEPEPDE